MTRRIALDSNILIYAALEPASDKGVLAAQAIHRASSRDILAAQVLLEFVAVTRRRSPDLTAQAIAQAYAWAAVFEVAPTSNLVTNRAFALVRDHQFQVWDAVIWSASREAGATLLLTEDLQDGLTLDGMRAANPFAASEADLATLLSG